MRTEKEIREKIAEYENIVSSLPWWEDEKEFRGMVLDTLLWVVEDEKAARYRI